MAVAVSPSERAPTARPLFSIGQLKKAIPAHCFERSLWTSSLYLGGDLAMAASLYFVSTLIPFAPAGLIPPTMHSEFQRSSLTIPASARRTARCLRTAFKEKLAHAESMICSCSLSVLALARLLVAPGHREHRTLGHRARVRPSGATSCSCSSVIMMRTCACLD